MRTITGPDLARAYAGGAEALRRETAALNAINVFPVPDGDTGTNMSLTMRAAVDELARSGGDTAEAVARATAQGALMGAKGNSGVILSQILAGVAAMDGTAKLGGAEVAAALARARDAAYRVVSKPREGTILSAITGAAAAAQQEATGDALAAMAAAVDGAREAVERTPELLPVLKEAGVVDAGAQGLFVLLDGMLRTLRGEELAAAGTLGAIDAEWLMARRDAHDVEGSREGFCTEFVISGGGLDTGAISARLTEMGGTSALVVGGGELARVHVHTHRAEEVLAYARTLGTVSHEKVDDMEAQFRDLAPGGDDTAGAPAMTVVAVAAGDGMRELFESMGARVVHGGQTMNPSAGDLRDAIAASRAADVLVLPNNKNIIMAAHQAAAQQAAAQRVHVIETRSMPQGIAAMIAFNAEEDAGTNVAEMTGAAESIASGEVTLAARATTMGGLAIAEGQPIGIIDGALVVAEESIDEAVRACLRRMLEGRESALVTLYPGEGVGEDDADALAEALRQDLRVDVECVPGGQPHYPYLISVE
jgi:hypothetical protein